MNTSVNQALLSQIELLGGEPLRHEAETALNEGDLDKIKSLEKRHPIDVYGNYPQIGDYILRLRDQISSLQSG